MSFLVKTAKTLRNHWKKSTFFFCVSVYGLKYANDRHNDNLLRRRYCEEAKKYGEDKIQLGQLPRRVTVFLNPAAQGGKARKLFEKTAAPILYLAGIEVNVVSLTKTKRNKRTEYEGQVKNFMTVLDNKDTDAVVVAGGNGTVLEAVTGFLRKEDGSFSEYIPVGVIPLGSSNRVFKILFGQDLDQVRAIADAAIAVVRAVTRKVDVIKLEGGEGQTIYAMIGLEAGAYRDAEERKSKYWYFGPLKSRWTYLRTAMKDWPPTLKASVSYIEATEQNMRGSEDSESLKPSNSKIGWNFISFLFGKKQDTKKEADRRAKEAEQEQEDEKHRVTRELSTVELTVTTTTLAKQQTPLKALQMTIGSSEPTKTQFINEGWSRIKKTELKMGSDGDETIIVKKVHIEPKQEGQWYNIDGESFEAMPVEISLLRNKLNFFCPQETASDR